MATDGKDDKRHVWGPRPVAGLVARLTRPAFRHRSPATAQILADWPAMVGPALAAVTSPRRLSGSTLTLACGGPIAMELQHMSAELIGRINAHLGRVAVQHLRFVQDTQPAPLAPAPMPDALGPPPAIPGIAPGGLHDALARLGQRVQGAARRRRT